MNEKISMNDTLSSLNAIIKLCNYAIEQSNDENLRTELITARNTLETLQWNVYTICKEKGYYIPAAPAGEADIEQVKNTMN